MWIFRDTVKGILPGGLPQTEQHVQEAVVQADLSKIRLTQKRVWAEMPISASIVDRTKVLGIETGIVVLNVEATYAGGMDFTCPRQDSTTCNVDNIQQLDLQKGIIVEEFKHIEPLYIVPCWNESCGTGYASGGLVLSRDQVDNALAKKAEEALWQKAHAQGYQEATARLVCIGREAELRKLGFKQIQISIGGRTCESILTEGPEQ